MMYMFYACRKVRSEVNQKWSLEMHVDLLVQQTSIVDPITCKKALRLSIWPSTYISLRLY